MFSLISLFETGSTMLYIDPAATSVLLSSITAIVIAVGASAIILWRKLKKKVGKVLNIDPNAGKEVEEDLVISDAEVLEETKTEEAVVEAEEKPAAEEKAE